MNNSTSGDIMDDDIVYYTTTRAILDDSILCFIILNYNKEMKNAYIATNDDMEHGVDE